MNKADFWADATRWPKEILNPPSIFIPVDCVKAFEYHHPDSIEMVPRAVLEKAINCLSKAKIIPRHMHDWLKQGAQVLSQTVKLNTLGAALIALGAVGTFFVKPEESRVPARNRKSTFIKGFSYASIATGLALVLFSSYRMNSIANSLESMKDTVLKR